MFFVVEDGDSYSVPCAGIFADEEPLFFLVGVSRTGRADRDVEHVSITVVRKFKLFHTLYGRCQKDPPFGSKNCGAGLNPKDADALDAIVLAMRACLPTLGS